MKSLLAAALATGLASASASAQSPTLTTEWTPIEWSQSECLARAEAAMQNLGLVRIERVGASVFADSSDQLNQVAIRCVADRQMAFIVAAGNHNDLRVTEDLTRMLLTALRDARDSRYPPN
jgi:hypothetical protein